MVNKDYLEKNLVVYRGRSVNLNDKNYKKGFPSVNGTDILKRMPKKFHKIFSSEPWWLWSNYALGSRYWYFTNLLVHGCYKVPSYIFVDKYDKYLKLNNYQEKFKWGSTSYFRYVSIFYFFICELENYSNLLLRNRGFENGLILFFKHLVNYNSVQFSDHIFVLRDEIKDWIDGLTFFDLWELDRFLRYQFVKDEIQNIYKLSKMFYKDFQNLHFPEKNFNYSRIVWQLSASQVFGLLRHEYGWEKFIQLVYSDDLNTDYWYEEGLSLSWQEGNNYEEDMEVAWWLPSFDKYSHTIMPRDYWSFGCFYRTESYRMPGFAGVGFSDFTLARRYILDNRKGPLMDWMDDHLFLQYEYRDELYWKHRALLQEFIFEFYSAEYKEYFAALLDLEYYYLLKNGYSDWLNLEELEFLNFLFWTVWDLKDFFEKEEMADSWDVFGETDLVSHFWSEVDKFTTERDKSLLKIVLLHEWTLQYKNFWKFMPQFFGMEKYLDEKKKLWSYKSLDSSFISCSPNWKIFIGKSIDFKDNYYREVNMTEQDIFGRVTYIKNPLIDISKSEHYLRGLYLAFFEFFGVPHENVSEILRANPGENTNWKFKKTGKSYIEGRTLVEPLGGKIKLPLNKDLLSLKRADEWFTDEELEEFLFFSAIFSSKDLRSYYDLLLFEFNVIGSEFQNIKDAVGDKRLSEVGGLGERLCNKYLKSSYILNGGDLYFSLAHEIRLQHRQLFLEAGGFWFVKYLNYYNYVRGFPKIEENYDVYYEYGYDVFYKICRYLPTYSWFNFYKKPPIDLDYNWSSKEMNWEFVDSCIDYLQLVDSLYTMIGDQLNYLSSFFLGTRAMVDPQEDREDSLGMVSSGLSEEWDYESFDEVFSDVRFGQDYGSCEYSSMSYLLEYWLDELNENDLELRDRFFTFKSAQIVYNEDQRSFENFLGLYKSSIKSTDVAVRGDVYTDMEELDEFGGELWHDIDGYWIGLPEGSYSYENDFGKNSHVYPDLFTFLKKTNTNSLYFTEIYQPPKDHNGYYFILLVLDILTRGHLLKLFWNIFKFFKSILTFLFFGKFVFLYEGQKNYSLFERAGIYIFMPFFFFHYVLFLFYGIFIPFFASLNDLGDRKFKNFFIASYIFFFDILFHFIFFFWSCMFWIFGFITYVFPFLCLNVYFILAVIYGYCLLRVVLILLILSGWLLKKSYEFYSSLNFFLKVSIKWFLIVFFLVFLFYGLLSLSETFASFFHPVLLLLKSGAWGIKDYAAPVLFYLVFFVLFGVLFLSWFYFRSNSLFLSSFSLLLSLNYIIYFVYIYDYPGGWVTPEQFPRGFTLRGYQGDDSNEIYMERKELLYYTNWMLQQDDKYYMDLVELFSYYGSIVSHREAEINIIPTALCMMSRKNGYYDKYFFGRPELKDWEVVKRITIYLKNENPTWKPENRVKLRWGGLKELYSERLFHNFSKYKVWKKVDNPMLAIPGTLMTEDYWVLRYLGCNINYLPDQIETTGSHIIENHNVYHHGHFAFLRGMHQKTFRVFMDCRLSGERLINKSFVYKKGYNSIVVCSENFVFLLGLDTKKNQFSFDHYKLLYPKKYVWYDGGFQRNTPPWWTDRSWFVFRNFKTASKYRKYVHHDPYITHIQSFRKKRWIFRDDIKPVGLRERLRAWVYMQKHSYGFEDEEYVKSRKKKKKPKAK